MNQPQHWIVQAKCTGMGWVNTKHGGETLEKAQEAERRLLNDDNAWLPGKRETRIVGTK